MMKKKITRRSFLRAAGVAGLAAGAMGVLSGCGGSDSASTAASAVSGGASSAASGPVDTTQIKDNPSLCRLPGGRQLRCAQDHHPGGAADLFRHGVGKAGHPERQLGGHPPSCVRATS